MANSAHCRTISSCTKLGEGSRTPSTSSVVAASMRSCSRVVSDSPSSVGGAMSAASSAALVRPACGEFRAAVNGASRTAKEPGECSPWSRTTPRVDNRCNSRRTASRTTGTRAWLWLPRPVITRTSFTPSTCFVRSQLSVRLTASAADGSDARRFKVRVGPNRISSRACWNGRRTTRVSAGTNAARGRRVARSAARQVPARASAPCPRRARIRRTSPL